MTGEQKEKEKSKYREKWRGKSIRHLLWRALKCIFDYHWNKDKQIPSSHSHNHALYYKTIFPLSSNVYTHTQLYESKFEN